MATTLTRLLIHVTFSTKNRAPLIPESVEPALYAYTGGICRRLGSPLLTMGGVADHVHMLVSLSKTLALADLLLEVKRDSSKWMKEQDAGLRSFRWQDGYFGFTIGGSGVEPLRAYIANQKQRHRRIDFKDEVRTLLRKYGVDWDERYVWE